MTRRFLLLGSVAIILCPTDVLQAAAKNKQTHLARFSHSNNLWVLTDSNEKIIGAIAPWEIKLFKLNDEDTLLKHAAGKILPGQQSSAQKDYESSLLPTMTPKSLAEILYTPAG